LLGTRFGAAAVDCLLKGQSGVMVGVKANQIVVSDLETILSAAPELSEETLRLAEPLAH